MTSQQSWEIDKKTSGIETWKVLTLLSIIFLVPIIFFTIYFVYPKDVETTLSPSEANASQNVSANNNQQQIQKEATDNVLTIKLNRKEILPCFALLFLIGSFSFLIIGTCKAIKKAQKEAEFDS